MQQSNGTYDCFPWAGSLTLSDLFKLCDGDKPDTISFLQLWTLGSWYGCPVSTKWSLSDNTTWTKASITLEYGMVGVLKPYPAL
jgi:hypothetical protein